jgi:two-component system sensor histidine kinase TctE
MPKSSSSAPSLRRTLLVRLLMPLLPLLLASVVVALYMADHFTNQAYNRSLFRATLSLADQITVVNGRVMVDLPQAAFDMLEYDKDDWIYYKVTGPHGEFVTGYEDLPLPPVARPQAGQHYYYDTVYDDKEISVAAFYLSLEGTSAHGTVIVQVAETTSKRDRAAQEIVLGMLLPLLLMMLLATMMVWRGVGRGLSPLESLRQQIASRSHRDLSPLNLETSPTEVVPILQAMNGLMSRLEYALAQQQRFVADASHQLRTPLAGLKAQAALASGEQDPQQLRHALEQIQTSSTTLAHTVNQLLSLARLEPEAGPGIELESVDLAALARDATRSWVPTALTKDQDLGYEGNEAPCMIQGSSTLLRELLNNLIDNALRYTPKGGCVTVRVENRPDAHTLLSVEDDGPGIPAEQRERVFERFYRILGSGQSGCGLGLSIVQEIAQRHRATVSLDGAEVESGRGLRVSVSFPSSVETTASS